jgi:hypothetical protein
MLLLLLLPRRSERRFARPWFLVVHRHPFCLVHSPCSLIAFLV